MTAEHSASFIRLARKQNLKVTPQRVEIYRALAVSRDHPSAEQLHREVREFLPAVSLDTVYRTLATFVEHGLADRVNTPDDRARFELRDGHHHHFVCLRCKTVHDIDWPEFDRLEVPHSVRVIGEPEPPRVELRGICRTCSGRRAE